METRIAEVGDGIFQLCTTVPDSPVAFNQYLIAGDEPTLFHTGQHGLYPTVAAAVARVMPVESLRWITFGHYEADECGAMNDWLVAAPQATVKASALACMLSVADTASRAPEPFANGSTLDIGGHVLRWIDTPHVPHGWEAGVLYDESTRTLLCGDLFTRVGPYGPTTTDDIVEPAVTAETMFGAFSLHPASGRRLRELADLDIGALALMHGPVFTGDARAALLALADDVDERLAAT